MSRTKYSLYNAVSAVLLTLVNGLFGIIVTRLIISHYGSDFNGLNSTVNQIVNVLLIIEGGFTLASNVALFGPISAQDYDTSNSVLSATRHKFRRIGIVFLAVGSLVAFVYSLVAKTDLPKQFVFTVTYMAVIPQTVNLLFATTYRVLLQTQQKEYIINCFTAITIGLGHISNIFLILHGGAMWTVRFVTMCFALVNCFLISQYTKRHNSFLNLSIDPRPELIEGTKDVMAQKITAVIYSSWPIVFLSVTPSGGTMLASVYAVYNNVFIMMKALLHGVIDAPRLGFGQMLKEREREDVWPAFKEYEFVSVFLTFIAMTTTCGLILPFIKIYTQNVNDIKYYDKKVAILLVLIGTFEMIHIPSGHLINMSGNFRASKIFQIIACVMLIISMSVLGSLWGIYGMLIAILIVAIMLAIMEIGFIHLHFFNKKLLFFFRILIPSLLLGVVVSFFEMRFAQNSEGVLSLLCFAGLYLMINCSIACVLGLVVCNNEMRKVVVRGRSIMKRIIAAKMN